MENIPRITDILEHVVTEMCHNYCKWPDACHAEIEDTEAAELELMTKHCDSCPLCQLI